MRFSGRTARRVALIFGIIVFVGAVFFGYRNSSSLKNGEGEISLRSGESAPTAGPGASGSVSRVVSPRRKIPLSVLGDQWRKFQSSYGAALKATFTPDHRIASIRSGDVPSTPAPGFESGDKDAALKRARVILEEAGELIGLNHAFPLSSAQVQSDRISSQIEWVQTYDGIPVEPFGRVTIQLDERGGLRGLYSNYISDPAIGNEPTLDAQAAQEAVISELPFKPEHPDQIGQGQLILFAPGPQGDSSPVSLRYAYRFFIEGREVVVDASTGQIISERDQRVS